MNMTRRDAIKSFVAATAVAVSPISPRPASILNPPSKKTELITSAVDYLVSRIEKSRGRAYNKDIDFLTLGLPKDCDLIECLFNLSYRLGDLPECRGDNITVSVVDRATGQSVSAAAYLDPTPNIPIAYFYPTIRAI